MAGSRMKIGQLVPLKPNLVAENSISTIPIFEGMNFVGRNNLVESDKRVSRKHISLCVAVDGSAEVVVEGTNPIVFQSGGKRRKLCSQGKSLIGQGDILELIPGSHLFKYVTVVGDHASPSETNIDISSEVKRPTEENALVVKRNQQVLEDEAFARKLQDNDSLSPVAAKFSGSHSELAMSPASCEDSEPIRHFNVLKDISPLIFKLLRVQGLPAWANCSSVAIDEVIQGKVLVAILSNYMVDIDWLTSACPDLRKIPHVLVIHGESGATVEHFKKIKPAQWILHKPPLPISYGTHHSKAMLLVYEEGVRVVVHTANLIHVDWNNKTQGLWMQDFPWKDRKNLNKRCLFEDDLVDYLNTLKWPEFSVNLPTIGNVNINASFFKKFDYGSSMVRLIASVPGYHTGSNLKKWGHMKLQNVLQSCIFDKEFCKSPLVYQFSSLGSLDERWMAEFTSSMSAGISSDKSSLGIGKPLIIWPTVEDVRCSIEGYAAGSCIPSPQKNVEKDFLNKYWARWRANHVGRCRAMPHIKTYTRYNGQNLAWFLLTSANLSKAAWGALQKNNSQLMIRSYELGVLFLPSVIPNKERIFSCMETGTLKQGEYNTSSDDVKTKLATLCFSGNSTIDLSTQVIHLPVPYQLPPQPYTSEDVPWSWDRGYTKKDVYGQVWPR